MSGNQNRNLSTEYAEDELLSIVTEYAREHGCLVSQVPTLFVFDEYAVAISIDRLFYCAAQQSMLSMSMPLLADSKAAPNTIAGDRLEVSQMVLYRERLAPTVCESAPYKKLSLGDVETIHDMDEIDGPVFNIEIPDQDEDVEYVEPTQIVRSAFVVVGDSAEDLWQDIEQEMAYVARFMIQPLTTLINFFGGEASLQKTLAIPTECFDPDIHSTSTKAKQRLEDNPAFHEALCSVQSGGIVRAYHDRCLRMLHQEFPDMSERMGRMPPAATQAISRMLQGVLNTPSFAGLSVIQMHLLDGQPVHILCARIKEDEAPPSLTPEMRKLLGFPEEEEEEEKEQRTAVRLLGILFDDHMFSSEDVLADIVARNSRAGRQFMGVDEAEDAKEALNQMMRALHGDGEIN